MIIGEEIDRAKIGASLLLRTCDKMGNYCTSGGAEVQLHIVNPGRAADAPEVETRVRDLKDGSYELSWRSKYSGHFRTRVTIGSSAAVAAVHMPRSWSIM